MDSQDSSLNCHLPHHPQAQFRGGEGAPRAVMMSAPPPQQNYVMAGNNGGVMIQQQQGRVFPFNSMAGPGGAVVGPPDCSGGSAASPRASGGFGIEAAPAKKRRGRPRKYSPDGNIALGLSPSPVTPVSDSGVAPAAVSGAIVAAVAPPLDAVARKARGRPPGSVKKQLDALGSAGVGFTPHVITVPSGEDIAQKIMAFSQQGPRTVCILSANGSISSVTLRQPATCGGTLTLEGRYEIISLSGSFLLSESNGNRIRSGGLSVSLAGADGKVVGGGVSGMLTAATPVQVVVGSFIADGRRPKPRQSPMPTPIPQPQSSMLNFGGPTAAGLGSSSPLSEGPSGESEEENNSRSTPLPHPHHGPLPYNNAGQAVQPISMYGNMGGWPNASSKMLP
nr:AT-hook motif nuclear-localized protein 10 [Ipomoea batatas]